MATKIIGAPKHYEKILGENMEEVEREAKAAVHEQSILPDYRQIGTKVGTNQLG